MDYITIKNNQRIAFAEIPVLDYDTFYKTLIDNLLSQSDAHCVNYYGVQADKGVQLIC